MECFVVCSTVLRTWMSMVITVLYLYRCFVPRAEATRTYRTYALLTALKLICLPFLFPFS
ncbi:hypothetical protein BDV32DRAFT_120096 [Aspergillus pseudonomiae]|uniref:Uncharacterized protein n=1 Tax=Aspergillus pseudonomiae TaxID=1506151 RepID=A0A5N6ICP0_9EURO|nr:uncharacterized protein BDV37DRAFT_236724 [Aspergillus pseudonomiae]KAB8262793.1 hypothetical protein BDV32DRAFT_120096 [Aspergillus pseudonomiae]KAE8409717.1 hypothetical protein BDV37DRAFT_236724 [Aspergillus pseudonomiae]